MEKPIPNICPSCGGPLSDHAQCIAKDCERAQICDHCNRRLNAYGVCTNRLCLMAVCDICHVYLDVYGYCPNKDCTNNKTPKVAGLSTLPPDDVAFTAPTDKPEAPSIATCEACGHHYEAVLESCPSCTERMTSTTDDPFEDESVHQRLTIPCPIDEGPYAAFASGGRREKSPRKPSSPDVDIRIRDADELEVWEAKVLLEGESHD